MMIKRVVNVITRNLQSYSNSKISSLIIIIGPLILIIIVGALLQNASLKNIDAGIFVSGEGQFKEDFISRLNERAFTTTIEPSLKECQDRVIKEMSHVCIHLIKNESEINSYSPYEIYDVNIYVDFSKQRIVWSIVGAVERAVEAESDSVRSTLINDLRGNSERLSSQLTRINSELYTASVLISGLKTQVNIAGGELNGIRTSLSSSQATLEGIRNSGAIQEPYLTQLNQVIQGLDTSNEGLNKIDQALSNGDLNNIANTIQRARNAVNSLENELNKLSLVNNERLLNPILLSYYSASDESTKGLVDSELGQLDYIFPSFLIFFLLFDSLLLSTTITIKERKSKAYIRNRMSVNNGFIFILGNFLTVFLITLIQMAIILLVGNLFLGIDLFSNIASLIIITTISIFIFNLIGTALGYLFNSYESSISAASSIALLLFLFSSSIIPSEILPNFFSEIIKKSPLTLLETKMRTSLIFSTVLKFNILEIIALSSVFILFCLISLVAYKKSKEQEI